MGWQLENYALCSFCPKWRLNAFAASTDGKRFEASGSQHQLHDWAIDKVPSHSGAVEFRGFDFTQQVVYEVPGVKNGLNFTVVNKAGASPTGASCCRKSGQDAG